MNESEDMGGVWCGSGIEYQKIIAAYYLIVKEASEIVYEGDGQDTTIINEDTDNNSLEYIQAKRKEYGQYTLYEYSKAVFPQMWSTFTRSLEKYDDKGIYCTLITNVSYDKDLRTFMDLCERIRTCGYTLNYFKDHSNKNIRKTYSHMLDGHDPDLFRRFLQGTKMVPSFTYDQIKSEIILYFKECKVKSPHDKLAVVKDLIAEKRKGRITRNQVLKKIDSDLIKIKDLSTTSSRDDKKIKIFFDLNVINSKYLTPDEIPDEVKIFREMNLLIQNESESALSKLDSNNVSNYLNFRSEEIREIIKADRDGAKVEAQKYARLERLKWECKERFNQRVNSISQTFKELSNDEDGGSL